AGWFDKRESRSPCSLGFWLEYWVASYKHLLTEPSGFFHFLNYDKFCDNPRLGLQTLADMIDSGDPDSLLARAEGIRRMKSHEVDVAALPAHIIREADRIYGRLREMTG
ncbi:MAG: hypothetical protein PHV48_03105, partial [Candidatus Omnitrophica bacterium]|nr:hypothetical protein [Candidatus Omnitrophota bacterium]